MFTTIVSSEREVFGTGKGRYTPWTVLNRHT